MNFITKILQDIIYSKPADTVALESSMSTAGFTITVPPSLPKFNFLPVSYEYQRRSKIIFHSSFREYTRHC